LYVIRRIQLCNDMGFLALTAWYPAGHAWGMARVVDDGLLETVRGLPCLACYRQPCGEAHHVTTVKNGGGDVPENVMPLCHRCHIGGWHTQGPGYMVEHFPAVAEWLRLAGRQDVFDRIARARVHRPNGSHIAT
jgi:hypothetical protein